MMIVRVLFARVRLLAVAAVLCAGSSTARADLQINFNAAASDVAAGIYRYDVAFNNSIATNSEPAQRLQVGSFVTLFDVAGLTSVTASSEAAALFSFAAPQFGQTPFKTMPTDTTLPNVSLTYNGPTRTADLYLAAAFTVQSTARGLNRNGEYGGEVTKNSGENIGTAIGSIGSASVPTFAVPEPSGVLAGLAGLPCLGLVYGFFRRSRGSSAAITAGS